ncbi:serine hydrolase [Stigmatella sp. ncwal1]|uniref:Serine hydrolase n=1 Tax=Stigmatella ashevillensis TaxID=2995309 RepID=A0ABT5DME4_9BACT|nr:serine hydrolase [Stigmatella ashevillena]MDC0714832.1 serine hydrolase [Stigmatella ashevillena]
MSALRGTRFTRRGWVLLAALLFSSASAAPRSEGLVTPSRSRTAATPALLPPGTEPLPTGKVQALEARIREHLKGRLLAGLSVGVAQGDFAWTTGYGLRDIAQRRPATPRTTYRTASISKSFTAMAVLQLVEEGKVSLDDDIRRWVPEFPAKPWIVTVRQLLGHLGGVSHYRDPARENHITKRMGTSEALALFKDWPLVLEPGTEFVYTSYGFNLLGALIENASGMPYGKYLQEKVFAPAGMVNTALDDFRTRDIHHAVGYRRVNGTLLRSSKLDVSSRFAGGGARSSVVDLLAFGRAVMASTLVRPETTRLMQVSMETRDGRMTDYGMGWATYPVRGHYVVAHAGGQPETSTFLLLIPAERLAIALSANVEDQAELLKDLASTIAEQLLEGGSRRRPVSAEDPVDEVLHEGLYRLFTYGRAFHTFHRAGFAAPPEPGDLPTSFAEVSALLSRESLTGDPRAVLKKLKQAHEPRAHRLFIRVGVQMAEQLAATLGPEALAAYPAEGALRFFEDYLRACAQQPCPEALQFTPELRAHIARLAGPWKTANSETVRTMVLRAGPELPAALASLQSAFSGAPVHPDFSEEALELAQAPGAPPERTALLLDWAGKTHPGSIPVLLARAEGFLRLGDAEAAELLYRQALARPLGPELLSPEKLLSRAHRHPLAADLLRLSVKLYPDSAALWKALAARELALGNVKPANAALTHAQELAAPLPAESTALP